MTTVAALLRKDLLAELRRRETVPAMALFSLTAFVIFHFGLDRPSFEGQLAAGVLWVTLALASLLAVNRLFVAEHEQGGFDGFLLAPVDRTSMLGAKALALLAFLVVLELVAVPLFAILLLGPSPWGVLPQLVAVLLLADLGIATVGALTGHGAYGVFLQKPGWYPFFAELGIGSTAVDDHALMAWVGGAEMLLGLSALVLPIPAVLLVMVVWKLGTELVWYPLAGKPAWECVERWANYTAPLALLLVRGWPKTVRGWWR